MRAREFLKEYSREKTANVFGNKLIAALGKDKSYGLQGTELGKSRAFIDQKTKIGDAITPEQRQIILDQIMHYLEQCDPTTNKEYMQWLAKVYANQGIKLEDLMARGNSALRLYHNYKFDKILPPEQRDIGRLTFSDLEFIAGDRELAQAYRAKQEQDAAKTMPRGDAETVFENDKVRIIHPKDQTAACYYGQGTRWCTAATGGNNYFDRYNQGGPMYILLPKQPKYEGEKYQLHFESGQYMDESDHPVPVMQLINGRFGDLREFFISREPGMKTWIEFVDDAVLEEGVSKIRELAMDYVYEVLSDWEVNDDSYYRWLEEEGYWNEETGEFDWDRVSADDVSYLSYNYEASGYLDKAENALNLPAGTVREIAKNLADEYRDGEPYDVSDLDRVIAGHVEYEFSGGRRHIEDGGLSEFINEKIWVKYNPETKEVDAGIVKAR